MKRLIYRYVNDTLKLVQTIDESSTHYYWIDPYSDEIHRDAKINWFEVPDSAYVDVTDACACEFRPDLTIVHPHCEFYSTRAIKKRAVGGAAYFVVEQIDVDKLPKRKS